MLDTTVAPSAVATRPVPAQEQWETLFRALFADIDFIARRVRIAIQQDLPGYRLLPSSALDAEILMQVAGVLRNARRGGDSASTAPLSELDAVGAQRGSQGIPVDEMLRAWTVGVQVVIRYAREHAGSMGVDSDHVLEFIQSTLAWSDAAMATTAAAHRGVELKLARESQERLSAFARDALFGTLAPAEILSRASTHGLDAKHQYVAVRARPADGPASQELDKLLPFRSAGHGRNGASTLIDGDLAGFVRERPAGQTAATIGVGPARTLDQIGESFRLATRALDTAHDFGLSGVHDLAGLGLRVAVAADRDVGEAMYDRYVAPIALSNSGQELLASLREYLACGMHVETTAERLFVHQNTVRYRVARCEEAVHASLRDPRVAMEVSWGLDWAIVQAGHAAEPRNAPLEQPPIGRR